MQETRPVPESTVPASPVPASPIPEDRAVPDAIVKRALGKDWERVPESANPYRLVRQ